VADVKGLHLSGFPAWAMWLLVHIVYLIGFQNRLLVLMRWTVSFLTRGRGARLIVPAARLEHAPDAVEERGPDGHDQDDTGRPQHEAEDEQQHVLEDDGERDGDRAHRRQRVEP
jgi:hypothetical protein